MRISTWFRPAAFTRAGAASSVRRASRIRVRLRLGALALAAVMLIAVADPSAARRKSQSIEMPRGPYYEVTRVDPRLCPSPFCGGVFVKRLNSSWQPCADGSLAEECYAGRIDWSALVLTPDEVVALEADLIQHRAIVRGRLKQVDLGFAALIPVLVVSNAWRGVTGAAPKDGHRHFGVVPSGIVCITSPCPSLTQLRLNSRRVNPLHELDLTPSGATGEQIGKGLEALSAESGLIVYGTNGSIEGPAGSGRVLRAGEFYVEVPGPGGPVCGAVRCAAGQACCNPVMGICTPPLQACIQ
jgi:hypothetical protein